MPGGCTVILVGVGCVYWSSWILAQLICSEEQHVLARPRWLSISTASYQIASLSTKTYVVSQSYNLLAQSHIQSGLCSCAYTTNTYDIFDNHLILLLSPKPQELVPIHPVHNVQDWDAAAGAISWDRFVEFLRRVKEKGVIPPDHRSHDHLNEQKEIKVEEKLREKWINEFETIKQDKQLDNKKIIWGLVDGFLLYWNKVSVPGFSRSAFLITILLGCN